MAPNTATAGKSYAQKAADLFMTAVGMKSATQPCRVCQSACRTLPSIPL